MLLPEIDASESELMLLSIEGIEGRSDWDEKAAEPVNNVYDNNNLL